MFFARLRKPASPKAQFACRPHLEWLEARDLPSAAHVTVQAGQSIQTAINNAAPNTTIFIKPGTYMESLTVDKAGIKLIGLPGGKVTIANPGGADNGVSVTSKGAGFALTNVVVKGFNQDGVLLTGVDGFALTHVTAVNDAAYGLFPVMSSHGVITLCSASGSGDTGIYLGQSSKVVIAANTVHDNLNGIEIENSSNCTVTANVVYNNTVGILVDLLPPTVEGITVLTSSHNLISANIVHGNNRANTAAPEDITATEESGVGILIIGGDHTTVTGNFVSGNNSAGIALLSGTDLIALAGLPADSYSSVGVDPNPSNTAVFFNAVVGNGKNPANPSLAHADLVASAAALQGSNNHWKFNFFLTSDPSSLP